MINRRDFLKSASLLSLGALAACNSKEATPAAPVENKNKGLGLQIYTLGPELTQGDLGANLKRIREMGIKNLELAGYSADQHNISSIPLRPSAIVEGIYPFSDSKNCSTDPSLMLYSDAWICLKLYSPFPSGRYSLISKRSL